MASASVPKAAVTAASAALLSGCATLLPGQAARVFRPLEAALTEPVARLEEGAASGDVVAKYALGLVREHGLQGAPQDVDAGRALRSQATLPIGTRSVPIYIPGVQGRPGTVIFVQTPTYGFAPGEARLVERCVSLLARSTSEADRPHAACGGPANLARLRELWTQARGATGRSRP